MFCVMKKKNCFLKIRLKKIEGKKYWIKTFLGKNFQLKENMQKIILVKIIFNVKLC